MSSRKSIVGDGRIVWIAPRLDRLGKLQIEGPLAAVPVGLCPVAATHAITAVSPGQFLRMQDRCTGCAVCAECRKTDGPAMA